MITREDIQNIIRENKSTLKENYKVEKIGIFGSFARGDNDEDSDIDIIVEFFEPIGWEFLDLKSFLEEILHRNVDLVTEQALKSQLKDSILNEVKYT